MRAALLLLLATILAAETSFPHERSTLAPDPAVRWGRLANGVRWAALENHQPKDRLSVRLRIAAGSLQERDEQHGLAHFLEHMAFSGTTKYPPGKLNETLQPLGIAFGNDSNAHTSFDETVYKLDLPDAKPGTLALALGVLADQGGGQLIIPAEVERERGVILAEMRDRDTPDFRQRLAAFAALFAGTTVPARFPIGTRATIEAATPALLRDYYERWYRPELMIVTVVGAIPAETAAEAIAAAFAGLAPLAPAVAEPPRGAPAADGLQVRWHHEPEAKDTSVELALVVSEPLAPDTVELRRARLHEDLAARVLSRRLAEWAERNPQGPIIGASASIGRWLALRIAGVSADVRDGRALAALPVIEQERRRLVEHGPTAGELAVARADLRAALEAAVARKGSRTNASLAGALYSAIAEEEVFLAPEQERDLYLPLVEAADAAMVRAAAARVFSQGQEALMVLGREAAPERAEDALRSALAASRALPVAPPAQEAEVAWGYGERPAAATPDEQREVDGARLLRFPNRTTAALLRTPWKPGEVMLSLRLSVAPAERAPGIAEFASAAFLAGGLGRHDLAQLRRVLAGSTARVSFQIAEDAVVIGGQCTPKDLELLLQQVRAYLTDPGWRPEAEAQAKSAWLQALAGLDTDLDAQVGRTFTRLAVHDAPQRRQATLAEAQTMSFAVLRAWLDPVLAKAPLQLAIVGDIDVDAATALAASYVGALPPRDAVVAWTAPDAGYVPAPALPAGEHRLAVPGTVARALVTVAWATDDSSDIQRNRRVGMLRAAFNERLRQRLREQLGQAYSPYVTGAASDVYRGSGWIQAVAAVEPKHADTAREAILATAQALVEQGVDAALLEQIKPPVVKSLPAQRQQNGYWLNQVLGRAQLQPHRFDWARSMEADFAAIGAEEISALAKRYLVGTPLIVIGVCEGK